MGHPPHRPSDPSPEAVWPMWGVVRFEPLPGASDRVVELAGRVGYIDGFSRNYGGNPFVRYGERIEDQVIVDPVHLQFVRHSTRKGSLRALQEDLRRRRAGHIKRWAAVVGALAAVVGGAIWAGLSV